MRIKITTTVEQNQDAVFRQFDETLFLKLAPPGLKVDLLRFDGCKKGDIVQLQLDFLFFKQVWTSYITESGKGEQECFFVDASDGKDLPFFLRKWQHRHRIVKTDTGTKIIDDIKYRAPLGLNLLLYPALWLQFAWRKPIYKRFFKNKK